MSARAEHTAASIDGAPIRAGHLVALVAPILRRIPDCHVGVCASGWAGGDAIEIEGRTHRVVFAGSSLAAREALDAHDRSGQPPMILLTPVSEDDLGWDVLVRLTKRRLFHTGYWEIVRELFRVHTIDPRISTFRPLARLLVEAAPANGYPVVPSGILDADTAWRHVFERALGLRSNRPGPEELLTASLDATFIEGVRALAPDMLPLVIERIEESAGALGRLIMRTTEAGNGASSIAIGVVCEVLFPSDRSPDIELARAAVRLEPMLGGSVIDTATGRTWAAAARRVVDRLDPEQRSRILGRAHALLEELGAVELVGLSSLLPAGYGRRLSLFGRALGALVAGTANLIAVEEAAALVRAHESARSPQEGSRLESVDMAVRLARYLHHSHIGASARRTLAEIAAEYAAVGSWIDLARTTLIGSDADGDLAQSIASLSERIRDDREQMNRMFAERFANWNQSPGYESGLVRIEQVLDEIVVTAARATPVLLLVLDGLNFASFRMLREQLGSRGWEEWTPSPTRSRAAALAASPCITKLSRTSLFAGALVSGTATDEKRLFAQHTGLLSVSRSKKRPVLFHKGELAEGAASGLAASVRGALGDSDQRVVGIVLNGLDDALAKSDQVAPRWTLDRIRLLEPILHEAFEAGRTVILTGDHGHVLESEGVTLPGNTEERWRSYAEPIAPEEIVLAGPRIEALVGAARIVAPWSERVRYVRRKAGYHGGVTPQEMLVPIAILGGAEPPAEGWRLVADTPPSWWHGESDAATMPDSSDNVAPVEQSRRAPMTSRKGRTQAVAAEQPMLFVETQPAEASASGDWIEALLTSGTYRAQREFAGRMAPSDDIVRGTIALLARHGNRAVQSQLAQAIGVAEVRIPGILAGLQRVLNVDGYPVIAVDATGRIELDRTQLRKQFQLME